MVKEKTERISDIGIGQPSKPRVLVVDDEEVVRKLLYDMLKKKYVVDIAEGSGAALEYLMDYQYCVIFLDVNMPGISGSEILKYCKKNLPYSEIIMISGDPEIDTAVETVKLGAFTFIQKPFTVNRIIAETEAAIKKYKENISSTSQLILNGSDFANSTTINEYRVIRSIGSGNMGVVLLVERQRHKYAMKILRTDSKEMSYDKKVQRFLREAEILSKIDHPNVIRIYDFGMPDNKNMPYIVMEFIDGEPLIELIKNNSLSNKQKLAIMRQLVEALEKVHEHGIVHRDIKPSNVLVDREFSAKLTDFGIARVSDSDLTMANEVLGSPVYMSPECFDTSVELDARSDIFSLGVLCYELFTSTKPFNGNSLNEIMNAIKRDRPVEPITIAEKIPAGIQDMLGKMLNKNPKNRYQNCQEIIEDFSTLEETGKNTSQSAAGKFLRRIFMPKSQVWS